MPPRTLYKLRTSAALVAALLLVALPASALGAEAEAPPAGSGWVGQEGAAGGAGGGSAEAQQGSSLGSGGGSAPAPEPEPQPVESSPPPAPEPIVPEASAEAPAPAPTPSLEEPSAASAAAAEAPVARPLAEEPDPRSELAGGTAPVGTAVLGASASSGAGSASPLPLAVSPDFSESSDSGGLNLYSPGVSLAIVLGFVLAGLAGRFALQRWRRRQRFNREAAEWKTAVRRLEPEQPKLKVLPGSGDRANGRPAAPRSGLRLSPRRRQT